MREMCFGKEPDFDTVMTDVRKLERGFSAWEKLRRRDAGTTLARSGSCRLARPNVVSRPLLPALDAVVSKITL
jgi:hypothetical protein